MKQAAAALVITALCCFSTGGPADAQQRPGAFDFYVLALSWSPTWCQSAEAADRSPQCRTGARHRFIVHGLWPQNERGYPEFCGGQRPERVPAELADEVRDIMPDRQLVFHAWRKHGTCTGLSPGEYLETTRSAFQQVAVPESFLAARQERTLSASAAEAAFIDANLGLDADEIAVACGDGFFEEVRICMTRDLRFRPCAEVDRSGCRQPRLRLPPPA